MGRLNISYSLEHKRNEPGLQNFLESNLSYIIIPCLIAFFLAGHFLNISSKYMSLCIMVEFLSIFMSFSIALILWYTYEYSHGFLQILGSSFLIIGSLKFFHALSFPGMPQFITENTETKTLLFWVVSRLLESGALLISGFVMAKKLEINLDRRITFGAAIIISGITLLTVSYYSPFLQRSFFITSHLIASASIVAILLLAIFLYWKGSKRAAQIKYRLLLYGMIASIFAEVALAFHTEAGDAFNLLGHIYKLLSYTFIFHVLFGHTVRKPFQDIERLLHQTISSISRALDGRDKYTYNHSVRVAEYACVIGQVMKVDKELTRRLKLSGLLHDIGKIAVSDSILNKEGPLTDEEWEMIKMHPVKGVEILEPIEQLQILRGIAEHHERMDSKGYPLGKAGDDISLEAMILAVADTFDAITSDRAYRRKKNKEEAIDILLEAAGTQLDSNVVHAFIMADREGLIDLVMEK